MFERLDFHFATMDDLNDIFELVDMVEWGETSENIRSVIANSDNQYISLIDPKEGQIVGIVLAVQNDNHGSIGHVIVKPEFRKMGLGEELMIEAINHLKSNGCTTIRLDAVQKAKTLYERCGFTFELDSRRYSKELKLSNDIDSLIDLLAKVTPKNPVHHIKEHDLSDIVNVDTKIFGVSRKNFLFYLFSEYPNYSFISRDTNDNINGYLFGSYQEGVLQLRVGYADSYEVTVNLLKSALIILKDESELANKIKVGIIENSEFGIKVLEELAFEHYYTSLRMFYGTKNDVSINPKLFAIGDPAKG